MYFFVKYEVSANIISNFSSSGFSQDFQSGKGKQRIKS